MKLKVSLSPLIIGMLASFTIANAASAQRYNHHSDDNRVRHAPVIVTGVPATGPNRFCGELLWSFEEQGITPLSFRQVGAYDPYSDLPEKLTPENCTYDQKLATIHDPILSFDPPGPAPAVVQKPDERLENIPLRDVPRTVGITNGGTTGLRTKVGAAASSSANPFPVYISEPSEALTLGEWASARGKLKYRCRADGTAVVSARFSNLIKNGVYTVWGVWRTTLPNGATVSLPSPFGGLPNAVVPNDRGRASFRRELPFCPELATEDDSLLLWVALAYHSDSAIYGGVPEHADVVTQFTGEDGNVFSSPLSLLMHHEHLAFPINFTSRIRQ